MERLRELEARVAALEGEPSPAATGDNTGRLTYGGEARLGGYRWQWEVARSPGWLVEQPTGPLAGVLAAAGHPARLRILQLLVAGPQPIADLQSELALASEGQAAPPSQDADLGRAGGAAGTGRLPGAAAGRLPGARPDRRRHGRGPSELTRPRRQRRHLRAGRTR